MPLYAIDIRDSRANGNGGPIGFCVEVRADNKAAALQKLRTTLPDDIIQPTWESDTQRNEEGIELRVYFYPEALTEADLEEVE